MALDPMTARIVAEMTEHPTAEVEMFREMTKSKGEYGDGTAEFTPGEGKTVVLKINGGANNVRVERIKIEGEED